MMSNNHGFEQESRAPEVVIINESTITDQPKEAHRDFSSDIQEDQVLAAKLQYVNRAIDEVGFTSYQMKLFFLNGFGYGVDSLLILLTALTQPQVAKQYQPVVSKAQTMAQGVGLLFGALFWGLGADVNLY